MVRQSNSEGGDLAKRRESPMAAFKKTLDSPAALSKIGELLPEGTAERFVRVSLLMLAGRSELQECTPVSVLEAVTQAAELGLWLTPALGHAYIVPFRNNNLGVTEATFIPGYRGLVELARRSIGYDVEAHCVYEGDAFEYQYGTEKFLTHRPCGESDPAKIECVYAITENPKTKKTLFEVMSRAQVERRRKVSKMSNGMLWRDWYDEACVKTVLRHFCKSLPLSPEDNFTKAISISDLNEYGMIDTTATERTTEVPDTGRKTFGFSGKKAQTQEESDDWKERIDAKRREADEYDLAQAGGEAEPVGETVAIHEKKTRKKRKDAGKKKTGKKPEAAPTTELSGDDLDAVNEGHEQKLQCLSCGQRDSITLAPDEPTPRMPCPNKCGTDKPMAPVENYADVISQVGDDEPGHGEIGSEMEPPEDDPYAGVDPSDDALRGYNLLVDHVVCNSKLNNRTCHAVLEAWLAAANLTVAHLDDESVFNRIHEIAIRADWDAFAKKYGATVPI